MSAKPDQTPIPPRLGDSPRLYLKAVPGRSEDNDYPSHVKLLYRDEYGVEDSLSISSQPKLTEEEMEIESIANSAVLFGSVFYSEPIHSDEDNLVLDIEWFDLFLQDPKGSLIVWNSDELKRAGSLLAELSDKKTEIEGASPGISQGISHKVKRIEALRARITGWLLDQGIPASNLPDTEAKHATEWARFVYLIEKALRSGPQSEQELWPMEKTPASRRETGDLEEWTLRDSNPRPLRCKRSALNQLS